MTTFYKEMKSLPKIMIVFDREIAERDHDAHPFYLRIDHGERIEMITLPGHTLPRVRKIAKDFGYEPTHHITVGSSIPVRLSF